MLKYLTYKAKIAGWGSILGNVKAEKIYGLSAESVDVEGNQLWDNVDTEIRNPSNWSREPIRKSPHPTSTILRTLCSPTRSLTSFTYGSVTGPADPGPEQKPDSLTPHDPDR